MKKIILVLSVMAFCSPLFSQVTTFDSTISFKEEPPQRGFMYVNGITWTKNQKQDSAINIFIKGDTMSAIRSLLIYCLQEKSKADNASAILQMLNLDYLKTIVNRREFTYYLKEYKSVLTKNERYRSIAFPQYRKYK